jgi:flagellar biosynthesis protein FlhG
MRTIAVTSGKGGVGKSNLSSNLGIAFAEKGKRVVVFDADLGLANVDVILGARAPYTLQHVISGEKSLAEIVTSGPGGIGFVAGGSGVESLINLSGPQLERFLVEIEGLSSDTDVLIFDTGAGVDDSVMAFCEAADEAIVVATPDPASIADAYATIKTLYSRKPNAKIHVVMNMAPNHAIAEATFERLNSVAQQFLQKKLSHLGSVRQDSVVVDCVRKRKPFLVEAPGCTASQDVKSIAMRLLGQVVEQPKAGLGERLRNVFGLGLKRSA